MDKKSGRLIPKPPLGDQEFLDNFLEFGLGHYYTVAKLLSTRISDPMTASEQRSIALEVAALTSAAFEHLVTWYYALRQWRSPGNDTLLVDILKEMYLNDTKRLGALNDAQKSTKEGFCRSFGILWGKKELQPRGINIQNWHKSVDITKGNISKVLEHLSPLQFKQQKAWMIHYLNAIKHGLLVVAGDHKGIPIVTVLTKGTQLTKEDGDPVIYATPTDSQSLKKHVLVIGNMAIALFHLVRLVYASVFNAEPKSILVDTITKDLYPNQGSIGGE